MYRKPAAPQSIGGVVDDAIRLYRSSFSSTWKICLGFALLLALTGVPMALAVPRFTLGLHMVLPSPQQLQMLSSPLIKLFELAMVLIEAALYSVLFACQNAVANGSALTIGQSLAAGLRRLPGFLLAGLIFCIAIGVGSVLLIIPGIYLWGKLELWPAALFAEDATAIQALGSSWNLTQDRWWRTGMIIFVGMIILYIVGLAVGLIPTAIIWLVALKGSSLLTAQLMALPFSTLSRIILAPAIPAILLAVHHDCKLRSEGSDLADRAAALDRT